MCPCRDTFIWSEVLTRNKDLIKKKMSLCYKKRKFKQHHADSVVTSEFDFYFSTLNS